VNNGDNQDVYSHHAHWESNLLWRVFSSYALNRLKMQQPSRWNLRI